MAAQSGGFVASCGGVPLFITLQELELHAVPFDVEVPAGEIEFDEQFRQTSKLRARGSAELLNHTLGEVRVRGSLSVSMEAACDRCLEPAHYQVEKGFDLLYQPAGQFVKGGEDEIEEAESELDYYEGDRLDLNDILREVVLLALPMRFTCREDCKGICPQCGQNRNQTVCDCQTRAVDDRWGQLRAIRVGLGPQS
jgi:uncharacterized protein